MRIGDYADVINKEIRITRIPNAKPQQYRASIGDAEIFENNVLVSIDARGVCPRTALRNLAEAISNKTIVFKAYQENRERWEVPDLLGGG
jgi:hypothetical protein